jgi:hypothetical protein
MSSTKKPKNGSSKWALLGLILSTIWFAISDTSHNDIVGYVNAVIGIAVLVGALIYREKKRRLESKASKERELK